MAVTARAVGMLQVEPASVGVALAVAAMAVMAEGEAMEALEAPVAPVAIFPL